MFLHEGGNPLVGVLLDVCVHAILQILLHVSIEEKVETCDIAEGDVLSEGGALLVPQRGEELEVKVTDLLLSD